MGSVAGAAAQLVGVAGVSHKLPSFGTSAPFPRPPRPGLRTQPDTCTLPFLIQSWFAVPSLAQAYTRSLAYDPEGAYLAAVSGDGTLSVWEIEGGKQQLCRRKACPKVRQARAQATAASSCGGLQRLVALQRQGHAGASCWLQPLVSARNVRIC